MYRVHHGLAGGTDAPTVEAALAATRLMLSAGLTNVLITRKDTPVTGRNDYEDKRDGRDGSIILEVGIM